MGIKVCLLVGLHAVLSTANYTLSAQSGVAEKEIANLLEQFFYAMKEKNVEAMQEAFYPEAILFSVVEEESGQHASLGKLSVAQFLKKVEESQELLNERLLSMDIRVDGYMATAWAPYEFYLGEELSHCGVNAFQFIYSRDGWQISHIMDTRRKEGCE